MVESFDGIVIGAGAAGLFCAAEAARRGRRIVVLEHTAAPGAKILISGGGRCNFTNVGTAPENFLSENPHFARSALARYPPADFIALVKKHGIEFHEKKLGQLFCQGPARQIVDMLMGECRAGEVQVVTSCRIAEVRRADEFVVETDQVSFTAPALVVATGGLSIPKIGATPFGYRLAEQFGIAVVPPRPALVPLVLNEPDRARWCDLAGVAADSVARFGKASFAERLLITHRGLSGPAVLQISSYWDGRKPISFALDNMPRRMEQRWAELGGTNPPVWEVLPSGTEGYAKAEVTAGGVSTAELSSKTMEARRVPGLFFVGEVVDVTGHLGGYNFQWAWASAWAAAQAL